MNAFVPGGQAGEESVRATHEAEVRAAEKAALREAAASDRPSLLKRLLRRLRRTH